MEKFRLVKTPVGVAVKIAGLDPVTAKMEIPKSRC